MLKPLRRCACCGTEITSLRSTKSYCSDACRKKASRGGNDFDSVRESWWLFENLRRNGLIGQIWPGYKWDDSPRIFALLDESGLGHAVEEMNEALRRVGVAEMELPTEADYRRALKDFDVEISLDDAGDRLKAAIKAFCDARNDRRIKKWDQKGCTPSDNGNSEP
jgi:hypothetical protein